MYVMSRDQRCFDNYGLAYAQDYALHYKLPLIVVFSFLPIVKNRAQEHFDFMLKGLQEVSSTLQSHDIPFVPLFGNPQETIVAFAQIARPALIVTDFSPLRGVRSWQKKVAQRLPLVVVDSHNCVPVWIASPKQEFGARTIRPKIHAV
jgi:deoxyribodipyrimidine photo-lyase